MTNSDKRAFVGCFNTLAVALRLTDADATMQRVYWHGLMDLPLEHVMASAERLSKTAQWFPKIAEWRQAVRLESVAQLKALPAGREEPWQDECPTCMDSGWEERTCYPGTQVNCGRKKCQKEAKEHRYVEPCSCRSTNRTYARHHIGSRVEYSA